MKQLFLILILATLNTSCDKDCNEIGMVQIEEAVIPDTILVNESIPIKVKAAATNGCWSNLQVDLKKGRDFEYSIEAFGTFTCCKNCNCPAVMVYQERTIDFQPTLKGNYIFRIIMNRNTINTDTLIVK